jgi:hypothetical protein
MIALLYYLTAFLCTMIQPIFNKWKWELNIIIGVKG